MQIKKKENWQELLLEGLSKRKDQPFKKGYHDCCAASGYLVGKMTGYDPMTVLEEYDSKIKATRLLIKLSKEETTKKDILHNAVNHVLSEKLNLSKTTVNFAKRGDVIILPVFSTTYQIRYAVGIIGLDSDSVILASKKGWAKHPLPRNVEDDVVVWSIP